MSKYSHTMLIGFIGKNPKYGKTEKGLGFCRFTMVTRNVRHDKKEKRKSYTYHNCIIWGALADVVNTQVIEKNQAVVIGAYQNNRYSMGAMKRSEMQLVVETIHFVLPELSEAAILAAKSAIVAEEEYGEGTGEILEEGDLPL